MRVALDLLEVGWVVVVVDMGVVVEGYLLGKAEEEEREVVVDYREVSQGLIQ